MKSYIYLGIAAMLPVLASLMFYIIDKKTSFGKANYYVRQVIIGIVFGMLAIIGTEWGIPMNSAQVNSRDSAVLVAGLMFGAPAGIIAGIIGGVERWIAVAWGIGTFTRLACSVSTVIAGFYSALLRKFMFENKKPGWLLSLAIGVVMEIFHLTMVFITNMSSPTKAMLVVKSCTVPMVVANGLSVMFSAMVVSVFSGELLINKKSNVNISQIIQRWLLIAVVFAFAATSYFVYSLQNTIAMRQTDSSLEVAIEELSADINDIVLNENASRDRIVSLVKNRHISDSGYIFVTDGSVSIISKSKDGSNDSVAIEFNRLRSNPENTTFLTTINGNESFCRYSSLNGYYIVAVLPKTEVQQMRNIALYVNTFMEILVFAILFGLIYLLIKKVVVNKLKTINDSLSKITDGDLGVVVDVRSNEEFASLSDDINLTVDTLKRYIDEASARIDKELEFAKNIQSSALPSVFPAFPKRKEFDIYALMNPAKEVGGDFYDFYITHGDTLNFLVADVSGKGIPAAMFMMRAKTELKSLTETDMELSDVFTNSNAALCEGNDAGMFVTAWQGSVDLIKGTLTFANAGHNSPLIRRSDGKFEYLKSRAGFVLAGMDGMIYKSQELKLEEGDIVFLYTDGVTEATNANNELYGEDRLRDTLNSIEITDMQELCKYIRADVDKFVGDAPQFDDITMVAFQYKGLPHIPSMIIEEATIDSISEITEFIESELEKIECPMKTIIQINIAIDELCSNIIKYGYPEKPGLLKASVLFKEDPNRVYIRFEDEGIPYNPLTKEDPDITLSADDRQIGGLGIFMVKKTMDDMKYKYENDKNILTIKKFL